MTIKERAAAIRAALKAKGWGPRDISVRGDLYSMGATIYVRIKRPGIPRPAVQDIALAYQSVRRDEMTGEMLLGGNVHVDVLYDAEALAPIEAAALPAIQALQVGDLCILGSEAAGGPYTIEREQELYRVDAPSMPSSRTCYDARATAHYLAVLIADHGATELL